jgi:putative ABC transport system permease protein
VPALVTSRTDLNTVIKDSSSRSGSGFRQNKTRSILVIAEVALAVVLLVGAALLIRSSIAINSVDPGFATENVLTMRTSLSGPDYRTSAAVEQAARRTLDRIETVPGVEAASMTCCVPLQGGYGLPFNIIGRDNEGTYTGGSGIVPSSGNFFDTFEIQVLQGRSFTERDDGSAPAVMIINEAFATQYWDEGTSPIGERVLLGGGTGDVGELDEEPIREIIGVVSDVRANGLRNQPNPISYLPHAQLPDALNALVVNSGAMAWVVRTRDDPLNVSGAIQNEIRQTTGLPLTDIRTMEDIVSISKERERVFTLLMTIFGAGALLLAAIGIYGLMAFSVQQRNQEIGIRMALGAKDKHVRAMVIKQGMLLVLIGVGVGLVGAWFVSSFLAFILYEVEPRDIATFIGVPLILVLISIASISIPAVRASRIDPLEALRYE